MRVGADVAGQRQLIALVPTVGDVVTARCSARVQGGDGRLRVPAHAAGECQCRRPVGGFPRRSQAHGLVPADVRKVIVIGRAPRGLSVPNQMYRSHTPEPTRPYAPRVVTLAAMDAAYTVRFTGDSTSAAARKRTAVALRQPEPAGARAAEHETIWRRNILTRSRRAVEAGIGRPADAESIARHGLSSMREQMLYGDVPVGDAITGVQLSQAFHNIQIIGARETEIELSLPYRGKRLYCQELADQLEAWVDGGIITSSCRNAVRTVQDNPRWLSLPDRAMVVLGAGAEMSPLRALLRWGADVVALDLPEKGVQERIHQIASDSAGRVRVPARIMTGAPSGVGADLTTELPAV